MLQLDRKQQLVIIVLAVILIFGGGYRFAQMQERAALENEAVINLKEAVDESEVRQLKIHVTGAVEKSGVYDLPEGSRVIDAVNKAVPTGEANLDALKLATPVIDGETIEVPFKVTTEQSEAVGATNTPSAAVTLPAVISSSGSVKNPQQSGGKVNINTADESLLDTLPGIGPAYAQRIIQYREINGPFKSIEDIKQVSGIGDKRFEQLKDLITVQ